MGAIRSVLWHTDIGVMQANFVLTGHELRHVWSELPKCTKPMQIGRMLGQTKETGSNPVQACQ